MGSGAGAGCGAGWCSPVAGPVGGVVMAGVLAHHLQVVGVAWPSMSNESAEGEVAVLRSTKRLCARRLRRLPPATGSAVLPGG
jgi:hypothetical protein